MNKILQDQLYAKYPKIFRDKDASMMESCMHWGIECGDGWYNVIEALCEALTYSYETSKDLKLDGRPLPPEMKWDDPEFSSYLWPHKGIPQVIADQVKEKFGTLRFYYHFEYDEEFQKMAQLYPNTAKEIREEQSRYAEGVVHMAETMSGMTCEDTGKPGEMHVSGGTRYGWYRTLNREHAKTDSDLVARGYVPVSDLPKEPKELKS